jgi:hypothetical protein
MDAATDLCARAPGEQGTTLLLVQTSSPEQDAGGAINERLHQLREVRSVWEQFLDHLMHMLGGPAI